jgi:hypothetical protein
MTHVDLRSPAGTAIRLTLLSVILGCGDSQERSQERTPRDSATEDSTSVPVTPSGERTPDAPRIDATSEETLSASMAAVVPLLDKLQQKRFSDSIGWFTTDDETLKIQSDVIAGREPDVLFIYKRLHGMTAQEVIDEADRRSAEARARYEARSKKDAPSASPSAGPKTAK